VREEEGKMREEKEYGSAFLRFDSTLRLTSPSNHGNMPDLSQ
jgi:hypothetical protein